MALKHNRMTYKCCFYHRWNNTIQRQWRKGTGEVRWCLRFTSQGF